MTIQIKSGKPISLATKEKICSIFAESQCPNESLMNSIPNFTNYGNGVVQLSEGDKYSCTIEVNSN